MILFFSPLMFIWSILRSLGLGVLCRVVVSLSDEVEEEWDYERDEGEWDDEGDEEESDEGEVVMEWEAGEGVRS